LKVQGMKHHQESVWNATYQLAYLERSKMQGTSPHMSNVMLRRSRPSIYTKADHRYGKIDTSKS